MTITEKQRRVRCVCVCVCIHACVRVSFVCYIVEQLVWLSFTGVDADISPEYEYTHFDEHSHCTHSKAAYPVLHCTCRAG